MSYNIKKKMAHHLQKERAAAIKHWFDSNKVEFLRPTRFKTPLMARHCDEGELEDLCHSQLYERDLGLVDAFRFDFRMMVATKRRERITELYRTVQLTPNYTTDDSLLQRWLVAVTGEVRAPDLLVMKHFLWQVKRKLAGLPTSYEMVPILFGPQGTGKTKALEALTKPISFATVGLNLDEVVAPSLYPNLSNNYIVILDELARSRGGEFKEVDAFKRIISAREVSSRKYYKQSLGTYEQNCTFVGSSNFKVDDIIYDSSGMRRFYQINTKKEQFDWVAINELDYSSLWRYSVDESLESPYHHSHEAFRLIADAQEDLRDITSQEAWVSQIGIESGEVRVSIKDAYSSYVQYCEESGYKYPITKIKLGKYLRDVKGIRTVKTPHSVFLVNRDFRDGASRGLDMVRAGGAVNAVGMGSLAGSEAGSQIATKKPITKESKNEH